MQKRNSLLAAMATFGLLSVAGAEPAVQTTLDGRVLQFDQPALMQDGRVMVPLRGIFESLGADVLFDTKTRTIKATKGDRVVELALGSREAVINGQMSYLDVPANTLGGRTLVPLRFVSEALGAEVRWSPATRTVALTSSATPENPQGGEEQPQASNDQPNLSGLVHNARRSLNAGDRLVVSMNGDPGGRASFDLLGVINNVPMREISRGRYEGELVVRQGMQIDRGTLVARLRKDGKEAVLESRRAVSIEADNSNHNGSANNGNFEVQPAQGATVNSPRPTVYVNMDSALMPGSARVFLDGQEVTGQASVTGSSVRYVPNYDLQNGEHRVSVQAQDRNGRLLTRDWNFQVYPQGVSSADGSPMVNLTNLANGANVPGVFTISGQTTPFAQVQIQAQAQRSLIPGVIGFQDKIANVSRQADANGRFNIQIDVSSVPVNSQVNLRIQASDQQGRVSTPATLDVYRR